MAGQGTPATTVLKQRKVAHRLHTYEHDERATSYGMEAAAGVLVKLQRRIVTLAMRFAFAEGCSVPAWDSRCDPFKIKS